MFFKMKGILFLLVILLFINSCVKEEVAFKIKEDTITILSPLDKENVSNITIIRGTSNNLQYVELQVDLNGWNRVNGVNEWYYSLNTKELENGNHVIYVRGFDGEKFTKIKAVRIKVNN